ncbi:MAG: peptide-methionine (R)-S-oxide reductase [Mangrovicoccus sp.]|nr:peptide-methionine (R)-S-oxide reductase [Mangrovicoccus sp.]
MTDQPRPSRREILTGSAAALAAIPAAGAARAAYNVGADTYPYEVTRSDVEWRAMLSDLEYRVMREGSTEPQRSSPLWNNKAAGSYHCKGCELKIYDGRWKIVLEDKGWLFFPHGEPNALLMGIDWPNGADPEDPKYDVVTSVETHCRRCGSHMGHYFIVNGKLLQCINGSSLEFHPSAA